jgi:hypothetical protein
MAKKETTTKKTAPNKKATVKKEKPIINVQSEPETVTPTVEEFEEALEALDNMNGDPAVLTPVENTDAPVEEAVQEEVEMEQTTHKENKPKKGIINRIFGYIWNGQEMDY